MMWSICFTDEYKSSVIRCSFLPRNDLCAVAMWPVLPRLGFSTRSGFFQSRLGFWVFYWKILFFTFFHNGSWLRFQRMRTHVHVCYSEFMFALSSSVRLSSYSSVCLQRSCALLTCRRLRFSAMFLRHLVRGPSVDIQVKFYCDRPRGTPTSGELNTEGYTVQRFWTSKAIGLSRKWCKIGANQLVLITRPTRNSHMSFRLVPNSVTLDDLERRNSPNRSVIRPVTRGVLGGS